MHDVRKNLHDVSVLLGLDSGMLGEVGAVTKGQDKVFSSGRQPHASVELEEKLCCLPATVMGLKVLL